MDAAFLNFSSCEEVNDRRIHEVLAPAQSLDDAPPRARVLALLDRMAEVLEPSKGAERILVLLSRMADCDWLEGQLEVRLRVLDTGTRLDLLVFDGLSLERLHRPLLLNAPLAELLAFIDADPAAIFPLGLLEEKPGRELRLRSLGQSSADATPALTGSAVKPKRDSIADQLEPVANDSRERLAPGKDDLQHKPTLKVKVVHIPREAYPDERERHPTAKVPRQKAEPPKKPAAKAEALAESGEDGIDDGWD